MITFSTSWVVLPKWHDANTPRLPPPLGRKVKLFDRQHRGAGGIRDILFIQQVAVSMNNSAHKATIAMFRWRVSRRRLIPAFVAAVLFVGLSGNPAQVDAAGGQFEITIVDKDTREPIACRIHVRNARGRARHMNKLPNWDDHFVCPGNVTFKLPKGNYQFTIDHGPEYVRRVGHFTIQDFSDDQKTIDLRRAVDMAGSGWWSGDLQVRRNTTDLELLMQAEDLHVALIDAESKDGFLGGAQPPSDTPGVLEFDAGRFAGLWGRTVEDSAGRIILSPVDRRASPSTAPQSSIEDVMREARAADNVWVDVAVPASWDLPVWLAHGEVDSIQLAFSGFERQAARRGKNERPPPRGLGRGSEAIGIWTQTIYYHVLNCGLRLPPTAASGSGISKNPLGYNRVYVFVGENFSYDAWWEGLRAGRVVVSNGPLIQPLVAGRRPGAVFRGDEKPLTLDISLNLATGDPVEYLEVIRNGEVAQSVRIADWAQTGELPPIVFEASGWFLIRAVTNVHDTYRFGSTAPYYVEMGAHPRRISRTSAQFFLDWLDLRTDQLHKKQVENPDAEERFRKARQYWVDLVARANAP